MTDLALSTALPATDEDTLAIINAAQEDCMNRDQLPIYTEHLLHAGMYSRTITMPPDSFLIGTMIKIPTTVVMVGTAKVLVGKEWQEISGYAVLPASAHRKQLFISESAFIITMIFPTSADSIEEAEDEFTSEGEFLLSRRQNLNKVTITEESA